MLATPPRTASRTLGKPTTKGEAEGVEARGFVFYHGQDVEAVGDRGLYLAFGAFDERDETACRIAGDIVSAV